MLNPQTLISKSTLHLKLKQSVSRLGLTTIVVTSDFKKTQLQIQACEPFIGLTPDLTLEMFLSIRAPSLLLVLSTSP